MRFTFMSDCLLSLLIDGMEMEEFEREKKSILHFNSCIGLVMSLGFSSVYFFLGNLRRCRIDGRIVMDWRGVFSIDSVVLF